MCQGAYGGKGTPFRKSMGTRLREYTRLRMVKSRGCRRTSHLSSCNSQLRHGQNRTSLMSHFISQIASTVMCERSCTQITTWQNLAKLYAAQHQFEDPSGSFLLPCFFKRAIWRLNLNTGAKPTTVMTQVTQQKVPHRLH